LNDAKDARSGISHIKYPIIVLALLLFAPSGVSAVLVDGHPGALNSLEAAIGSCRAKIYTRSARHDALRFDRFFDAAPDRQVLRADFLHEGPPVIDVAASLAPPGWILSRYVTYDGYDSVLQRPSRALIRRIAAYGLAPPHFVPGTMLGIRLGDPISKVTRVFVTGRPYTRCGLTMYSYAWSVRSNDDGFVTYGTDRAGRIEFIRSGDGCCGKNHLWDRQR